VRRILGYVRYDTEAAREAIDDLYGQELRLFQNLFLPSVKLEKKERIGSRLRRRYEAPQSPFQRVLASPGADAQRGAELQGRRESLDPFQLSVTIQAKLERIFALSAEAARAAKSLPGREAKRRPAMGAGAKGEAIKMGYSEGHHQGTRRGSREPSVPPAGRRAVDRGVLRLESSVKR
jgi:hypothetical protein